MIRSFKIAKGKPFEFSFSYGNTAIVETPLFQIKKHNAASVVLYSANASVFNTTVTVQIPDSATNLLSNQKYYYSVTLNTDKLAEGDLTVVEYNALNPQQVQQTQNITSNIITTIPDYDSPISDIGDLIPYFEERL